MTRKHILETPVDQLKESDIIFDWNEVDPRKSKPRHAFSFFDETLRDGLQSPSVVDPPIADKIRIVELMDELGVQHIDIGLPGAGPRAREDVREIATAMRDNKLKIRAACAARTVAADIEPIIEISQQVGIEIEVMAFIGSSSIRLYAEAWDLDRMLKLSADAIGLARRYNLPCTYVTEDTTRSHPEVLRALFGNAIEHGAHRLCLCDTVGHVTPDGVRSLIDWTKMLCRELGQDVGIDWHGHNDRGLALENALWAIEFGADRVHGTVLGVGERVGNTALDQVLLNMKLLNWIDNDLGKLVDLGQLVSRTTRVPIPCNYPLLGDDAFRTGTGVHAAAVIKAQRRGDHFLADRIYSGVPASLFGRRQEIAIGHMSGESNVHFWLEENGVEATPDLVATVFERAKKSNRLLTNEEIWQVINDYQHKAK
ncbi:MAG: 2-isopropylmalate synthase [Deltaproteobacteria bacterium]|nr:2-isopropylmalate synthase [Deltaproteobacteria bacterium]